MSTWLIVLLSFLGGSVLTITGFIIWWNYCVAPGMQVVGELLCGFWEGYYK